MTYVKNDNYWDADSVSITTLNFMLTSDDVAAYTAYQTGDLDFIDSADSKSLFAINLKGREGSTSEQDAINRTYRVLENNIATEFSKNFDSYINNLSFKSE